MMSTWSWQMQSTMRPGALESLLIVASRDVQEEVKGKNMKTNKEEEEEEEEEGEEGEEGDEEEEVKEEEGEGEDAEAAS